ETEIEYRPYRRLDSDVRVITFIGAVNRLYLDPLQKLLQVIEQWNATSGRFRLKLLLMTYTEQNYIAQELGHSSALELIFHSSSLEIRRRLQDSWVIFMPYSFAAEMRVMVSTSFPTKLIE